MKGIEKVRFKDKTIAMVFRNDIPVDGVKFFTDELNPFQIGFHNRKKGVALTPHIHKISKPIIISSIQELLFVLTGKIMVILYSKQGKVVAKKTINKGESILLLEEGHGIIFLTKSKIFEVKQGPYPGTTHAKIFLK
ncbi:MAG: hypothetical protein WCT77_05415 [Bacteroidota bacterium]|jgi:hypothetical protein